MHPYVTQLITHLEPHANPVDAVPMKAYMRNQFEYLGLKTGRLSELRKAFVVNRGLPHLSDLDEVLLDLWHLPQREYQYIALGLLDSLAQSLPPETIVTMETMLQTKSWWDTVDSLSGTNIGRHFKRFPDVRDAYIPKWRASDDFWLRRACLLFQLGYKQDTDFELLKSLILENLGSKEFFINKAIGWSLRTYSRVDAQAVRDFVAATPLHPLSAREALKWLDAQEAKKVAKT